MKKIQIPYYVREGVGLATRMLRTGRLSGLPLGISFQSGKRPDPGESIRFVIKCHMECGISLKIEGERSMASDSSFGERIKLTKIEVRDRGFEGARQVWAETMALPYESLGWKTLNTDGGFVLQFTPEQIDWLFSVRIRGWKAGDVGEFPQAPVIEF